MAFVDKRVVEKWKALLDEPSMPAIKDHYRRAVTAKLLENQEAACQGRIPGILNEAGEASINVSADFGAPNSNNTTNVSGYDPIMINMVRRSMPNLIAYDICAVQPMSGPSGLVFALRSRYATQADLRSAPEAFYNEADSDYSGTGTHAGNSPVSAGYTYGTGMSTTAGETLGAIGGGTWAEMGFTVEKVPVIAKTRALKGTYTDELQQDFRAVHGGDAEAELSAIMSGELLAEINREVVRTVYVTAVPGTQQTDIGVAGTYNLDVDSNGRWMAEKFKGMLFQIEREANQIAKDTRRGKGNLIVCSSDVASALALAGVLDYAPALSTNLQVDDTGNTFAGVLNGRYRVYIDPYVVPASPTPEADAGHNFFVVGYRGVGSAAQYDAGIFYCPYVPLQLYKALDTVTFQPRMGMKVRYGMVANPFAQGATAGLGALTANTNVYYRRTKVINLSGTAI